MAEYIEREALLKAMSYHNYYPKGKHFLKGIETAEEIIEHFPVADVQPVKYPSDKPTFMLPRPFDGTEEVYDEYYDTAGNYHYTGTITGHHVIKKDGET